MASNIASSFISQYADEVKQAFQQKTSKLLGSVKTHRNVVGSTYNFHTLGKVTANTKARDSNITALNPAQAQVTATLADYYAGIYIDKLDELKTNAALRQEYVTAAAAAIARKVDDVIITTLATASTTTTTTTGGLTIAKILEGLTYLNGNDVDPEDRVLVIGAKQMSEAMAISQLTSSDYAALAQINQSGVGTAFGFKWILHNALPLATVNRTCFAFNKNAIGVAIGQDITSEANYIPEKVSTLVNSYVSLGSALIEQNGIVKINCVE